MLAYQAGISQPPADHPFNTRLKKKYNEIQATCYQTSKENFKIGPLSPKLGKKFEV
jgi:hypothetical protein